jgi:hypothetical protein
MTKLDELPVAILDGGPDSGVPKEDRQHAWLVLAVLAARFGHSESLSAMLAEKGYSDERHLLAIILSEHGFDEKSVAFLLDCIARKRGRGRPRGSDQEFWASYLEVIKEELRADGHPQRGIHKEAMHRLEKEVPDIRRSMLGFAPAFNREQLEAYARRSKKPRPK